MPTKNGEPSHILDDEEINSIFSEIDSGNLHPMYGEIIDEKHFFIKSKGLNKSCAEELSSLLLINNPYKELELMELEEERKKYIKKLLEELYIDNKIVFDFFMEDENEGNNGENL